MTKNTEMAGHLSAAMPEAVNVYDAQHGRYMDQLPTMPTESKLPTQQMPMAPMPAPFAIKGTGTGER